MRKEKHLEEIRELILKTVNERLPKLKVAEVNIVPAYDWVGDPLLEVRVIYKGSYGRNKKILVDTIRVQMEIRRKIEARELSDAWPQLGYVPQREWEELKEEMANELL